MIAMKKPYCVRLPDTMVADVKRLVNPHWRSETAVIRRAIAIGLEVLNGR